MSNVIPEVADVHVGRQAIYDRQGDVAAYELLFRDGPRAGAATDGGSFATSQVMVAAFTTVGVEELAGGRPCFINLTADFLLGELPVPFAPGHAVLEVLETVDVDDRLVEGVAALVGRGYVIALDDFVPGSGHERLFALASYVKVDFLGTTDAQRRAILAARAAHPHLRFVAERLETADDVAEAKALGFELFQGYALSRPAVVSARTLSASRLRCVHLLGLLMAPDVGLDRVVSIVSGDPALSYRMLKAVNAAAAGAAHRVSSVHEAVVMLGTAQIRDWVTLMLVGDLTEAGEEQTADILVHAQLCRLIAESTGVDGDEAFTAGLLDAVAGLLGLPIEALAGSLPLAPAVRDGLLHGAGALGDVLAAVGAHERGAPTRGGGNLLIKHLAALAWATRTTQAVRST
ncbi:HDOD domain-containing protein [Dactylosporangium sp. NPDC006015]|uniref:EAL and HDOD domain-containing protein n=1 Tax=Dactylosporangium sp. NPDC006015 TaxID=3154576 RepID=UPI0033AF8CC0